MHQTVAPQVPKPGEMDLWEFELFYEGGRLSCASLRTLLYYMASQGTYGIRINKCLTSTRLVEIEVHGPVCRDDKGLWVKREVSASEISVAEDDGLSPEEITLFRDLLKRHTRRVDPQWHSPGVADNLQAIKCLGLPRVK